MPTDLPPRAAARLEEWLTTPDWYQEGQSHNRGFWRFLAAWLDERPDRPTVLETWDATMAAVRALGIDEDDTGADMHTYNLAAQAEAVYQFLDAQADNATPPAG